MCSSFKLMFSFLSVVIETVVVVAKIHLVITNSGQCSYYNGKSVY